MADVSSQSEITYGSVCSGIEAATVAWEPLGWKAAWFAEIEPFPSAVLAHHYPTVPNLGDMTAIARRVLTGEVPAPDVLVGGTPCQAFSVAGMRQSLEDARGNLTLRFVELVNAIDLVRRRAGKSPLIVVWENVPGVLSTRDNAFGCFLGGLAGEDGPLLPPGTKWANAGCVYGPTRAIAWRTLDAQYFGLAQRRRRVFVVASAREGFDPAQVLFEWEGLRRDSAPRRTAGQSAAASLAASAGHHGYSSPRGDGSDNLIAGSVTASSDGADENDAAAGLLVSDTLRSHTRPGSNSVGTIVPEVSLCLNAGAMGRIDSESETMIPVFFDSKSTHPASSVGDVAPTLRAMNHAKSHANAGGQVAVAFAATDYKDGAFQATDAAGPLTTSADRTRAAPITTGFHGVRRLTPVECERLQGFPDNYTLVDVRGKPAADGPRYKAIGNSMATNVMAWIGRRIDRAVIRLGDAA